MLEDRSVYKKMNVNELKPHPSKAKAQAKSMPASNERKVEKVISGSARTKKNEIRKFTDIFVAEDISVVKEYLFNDLFVPMVKRFVNDAIKDTADILIYGGRSGGNGRSSRRSDIGHVSYRSYYDDRRDERRERSTSNSRFVYDDILFDNRADAQAVLDQMKDVIDTYDLVRVLDLYDLAGVSPAPHTGHNFGWTNLSRAYVDRARDGYIIKLPKPVAID